MEIVKHHKETRLLGVDQGYLGLSVADGIIATKFDANGAAVAGQPFIQSCWKPTAEELAMLNAGGVVVVEQLCVSPPPMMLSVGANGKDL